MNTQELSKSESGILGLKLTVMTLDIDPASKPVTQVFYKDELTLGRLPSNDVVLGRPEISGIHARLRIEKGGEGEPDRLFITDLGSSNGTSVEKSQLRPRIEIAMMPNERIFIGNYVIKPTIIGSKSEAHSSDSVLSDDSSTSDTFEGELFDQNVSSQFSGTSSFKRNLLSDSVKEYESSIDAADEDNVEVEKTGFRSVHIDEDFTERSKTMEFKPPFGTPFTREEENMRDAKELPEEVLFEDDSYEEESEKDSDFDSEKEDSSYDESSNGNGYHGSSRSVNEAPSWIMRDATPDSVADDDTASEEVASEEPKSSMVSHKLESYVSDANKSDESKATLPGTITLEGPPEPPVSSSPVVALGSTTSSVTAVASSGGASKSDALSIKIKVDGADVRSINFVAKAFTDLRGKILHKGNPLSGVLVDGGSLGTTITQADGSYSFSKVLEGTDYKLSLSKDRFSFSPAELKGKVTINEAAGNVTATQLFSISGVITHQGVPLAGVEVNGGELGSVLTKEDGSYLFENVPEGKEYNLSLHKEGYVFKS